MKKIVGIIVAAALVAGAAVAQDDAGIRFGAWGRSIYSPVGFNGEDIITQGPQTSWDDCYRIGLGIYGVSENFGFEVNPDFSSAGVGTHDMDYVWCKPFDFLRIEIGQVRDQTLQRNAGTFGSWNWVRHSGSLDNDESFTFTMLANGDDSQGIDDGMILKIDPIDILHIGVFMGAKTDSNKHAWDGFYDTQKAEDTFMHYSAISAGLKIGDIGQIMLGFWGQETGHDDDFDHYYTHDNDKFWGKGEVAFDLTAVENLYVSIGAKIPTGFVWTGNKGYTPEGSSDWVDYGLFTAPFEFNVYGGYSLTDTIKLHALVGTKLYKYAVRDNNGKFDDDMAFGLRAGVGADIGIAEGLSIIADFRLATEQYNQGNYVNSEGVPDGMDAESEIAIGFMVGLQKSFSNGTLGIGFEGSVNDEFTGMGRSAHGSYGQNGDPADFDSFRFLVPINLTYWF